MILASTIEAQNRIFSRNFSIYLQKLVIRLRYRHEQWAPVVEFSTIQNSYPNRTCPIICVEVATRRKSNGSIESPSYRTKQAARTRVVTNNIIVYTTLYRHIPHNTISIIDRLCFNYYLCICNVQSEYGKVRNYYLCTSGKQHCLNHSSAWWRQ